MATPGLADVADDARVIAVVAAVGREVERHREAHLSRGEVGAVEGVRLLGGGEARVLADGPRPVGVHGGPHAAEERLEPGQRVDGFEAFEVGGGVERLDRDALRRVPHEGLGVALQLLAREFFPVAKRRLFTHAQRLRLVPEPGEVQLAWRSSWAARASSSAWRAAATPARPTRRVRASSCQSPQFTASPRGGGRSGLGGLGCLGALRGVGTLEGGLPRGLPGSFDEAELRGHNRSIAEGYDIYSSVGCITGLSL